MYKLSLITLLVIFTSCSSYKTKKDFIFTSANGRAKYVKAYDRALKLWGQPYEETDVNTSSGKIHVVMCGPKDGEPVVLFHGMDASSTMWYPNIKALSKQYRVYSIDFPLEAGKSIAKSNKLTNDEIIVFYNEVFDHFKLKEINLVGASRGGWMAAFLAMQPNNKVKKIVLISPAQTFVGLKQPLKIFTAIKLKWYPSHKRLAKFFNAFSTYPDKIENAYKEQFYIANVVADSRPSYLHMFQFTDKQLASLTMPVLVMIGDHDVVNNEKSIEKAQELIPKSEAILIHNAGHFLSIDQSETVNKAMMEFLNKK